MIVIFVRNVIVKKLLFIILFSLPCFLFAQSLASLNIFSENGDKFYLFLDGVKQNDSAYTNVRIQDLPDLYYSAKIVFADNSLAPVSKNNLYVSDGNDILCDAAYRLRRDKTAKPRLTFYSLAHAQQNFFPTAGMHVFHFGQPSLSETMLAEETREASPAKTDSVQSFGSLTVFSINADKFYLYLNGIKQNETAQSHIRVQGLGGFHYNLKIVFKDTKILPILKNNLFISDEDDNLMDAYYRLRRDPIKRPKLNFFSLKSPTDNFVPPAGMYVYNFNSIGQPVVFANSKKINAVKTTRPTEIPKPVSSPAAAQNKPVVIKTTATESTASAENKKCNGWPMNKADLISAKKAINLARKDEDKLSAARDIISANCLMANQVTEFCDLFKTEQSKLEFAKYAYKFTIDRKNYAIVNKALTSETSRKELTRFISGG